MKRHVGVASPPGAALVAATVTAAVGVFAIVLHTLDSDTALSDRQALGAALVQALSVVLALRVPPAGWAASTAAVVWSSVWVGESLWVDAMFNSYLIVLGVVSLRVGVRGAVGCWAATVAVGAALTVGMRPPDGISGVLELGVLAGLVMVAGAAVHGLTAARRSLRHERAHSALLAERAKIARELHDVVAHHMSVIAIQAEAARFRDPATTPQTLVAIRESAVIALGEMRRILGVLRSEDTGVLPQPTLAQVDRLADAVRATGTSVDMEVGGRCAWLTSGVELSAYRIVQEAMSNAVRHAPGAPIRVRVAVSDDEVRIEVDNDGVPVIDSGAGQGLIGMRERVSLHGGTMTVGPTPSGRFRVAATLPITDPR
ncbi:sensor histidine kinase [Nocardia aurea]|uniref:histidine kinase n=1 Tax=Nocardia aurea TaxID=2144174 RepID=A0ABV3FQV0_9NOCA